MVEPTAASSATSATSAKSFERWPVGAKLGLLGAVLVVVSAAYYFIFHMPLATELEAAISRNQQLVGELNAANHRQQEFFRAQRELQAREALDRFNKRVLPEQSEMASLMNDLTRVANASGLIIGGFRPGAEEAQEHYTRVPVQLQITGRFHQVAKFFYGVTRLPRVISMEDVRLGAPRVEADGVVLNVSVRATTFRRPQPQAQGGG